ncbi:MAG TPA: O-antigen ligase family protein, partial [Verrucomicrobiae bacterium]|nr:O-antigen ligase family protein [Verrucomicrobiae bacterium]
MPADAAQRRLAPRLPPAKRLFRFADAGGGTFVLAIVALSPWFFGTTESWSVWTMNILGYLAGLCIVVKWLLRWTTGAVAVESIWRGRNPALEPGAWIVRVMGGLTALVLFYCLVSALNARATYYPQEHRFEYHAYVPWLPFSYDSKLTWDAFWTYLGLACFFWAGRDWLLHPPRATAVESEVVLGLPPRFRILFWVIAINSTLLAIEGLFQRLSGTTRLLWFRASYDAVPAHSFGPFAFRGNAAQYFNLVWPVILGFWWVERERARLTMWKPEKMGGRPHIALLVCATLTAAAPMMATSQGGTLISLGMMAAVAFIFLSNRRGNWRTRCTVLFVCVSVLGLGGALGWDQLAPRMREAFRTPYANPNELYNNARQMALDYPLFGIGPGAFRALYPLYRTEPGQSAHAFLHDDWLETRVTFGWTGSMLVLSLLGLVLTRWFIPGGILGAWELVATIWVAVGGCLVHAKFSFPLQVYSIL